MVCFPWIKRQMLAWVSFLCLVLLLAAPSASEPFAPLEVEIYGPGEKKVNYFLALPQPLPDAEAEEVPAGASQIQVALEENLGFLPFLQRIPGEEILGEEELGGVKAEDIDFQRMTLSQVDYVLTQGYNIRAEEEAQVELRAFSARTGELVVGRGYLVANRAEAQRAADRFSAELMEALVGERGFFRSRIAYVEKQNEAKEIHTITAQGRFPEQLTEYGELSLSPAWSWDGGSVAFVLLEGDRHKLLVYDHAEQELREIPVPGNTVISPAFHPEGWIAASVTAGEDPDIHMFDMENGLADNLAGSWAIEVSPGFDREGRWMSFVSSRLGNPHIFLKDLQENEVERISYEGNYNTEPAISPDGRYILYTSRTEEGHRIFLHDRERGTTRQLTEGPGNDEDPAWGPNGYFLAFVSDRSGEKRIYITSRDGGEARELDTGPGEATSPAWSPEMDPRGGS